MLQDKPRCTDLSPLHTRILRFHLTSGKRNSYLAPRDISFFLLRLELAFFLSKDEELRSKLANIRLHGQFSRHLTL